MNHVTRCDTLVYVCMQGRMTTVDMKEIIYVEHNRRTIFLHTMRGVIYIPYAPLKQIQCALGNDYMVQCHKSFLVNRIHVERVDRTKNLIVLKNYMGKVALGRKYKEHFLRELHYIM